MNPYRVAVVGCAGRMGRMNLAAIPSAQGCVIVGGSDPQGNPDICTDIGPFIGQPPLGVLVGDAPSQVFTPDAAGLAFITPPPTPRPAPLVTNPAGAADVCLT